MTRQKLLKIVNPLLAVSFLCQAGSGLFHKALSHEAFEILHENGGYVLVVLALIHIALNWPWIRSTMMGYLKRGEPVGA